LKDSNKVNTCVQCILIPAIYFGEILNKAPENLFLLVAIK